MAGNSLDSYRAEIGCFYVKSTLRSTLNGHIVLLQCLGIFGFLYWLFLLLIFANDVELNPGPNHIKGFLLNTRSAKSVNSKRNKLALIQTLVSLKNALIFCLTETWLTSDIKDEEILPCGSFKIMRKDRGGYGGVMLAVHKSIKCKERRDLVPTGDKHNEIVIAELNFPNRSKIALVGYYRPPNDNTEQCAQLFHKALDNIRASKFKCVLGYGRLEFAKYGHRVRHPSR